MARVPWGIPERMAYRQAGEAWHLGLAGGGRSAGTMPAVGVLPGTFVPNAVNFPVTDLDGASLSPEFVQRLERALAALDVQAPVLHLWHTGREPLDAVYGAVLQGLRARGQLTHVCPAGEFLPLLHTLNTLIADSLRGAPVPTAQQLGVWVVDGAQALQVPHVALIERILTHFPELPLRLVLLSQTPLAPVGPASVQVMEVGWRQAEPRRPTWVPDEYEAPPTDSALMRVVMGLGAAMALALVAGGLWWGLRDVRPSRTRPAAEVAVPAASVPAVALASGPVVQASEPASAMAPASAPALVAVVAPAAVVQASAPVQVASAPAVQAAVAASAAATAAKVASRSSVQTWVQGFPEGSFLVLHALFSSAKQAETFKESEPLLVNARIVRAVWMDDQPARYGVLTGPFRSPERVNSYLQRLPWGEQAYSVSREDLLDLLSP